MDESLGLLQWLLATGVILLGAIIQGGLGYGIAILGAPLLFLIDPRFIPAPMILVGMVLPLLIFLRDWRAVCARDVGWSLPGSVMGTVLASMMLLVLPEALLGVALGVLVLLGVALSLLRRLPDPRPPLLLMAAGLSGFMATITSIGGPPLALAFQNYSGARLRGTMSAIFVPAGLMSLAALAWLGRLGPSELLLGLGLMPGMIVGFFISSRINRHLDHRWLRPAMLWLSALAGVAAIARSLV